MNYGEQIAAFENKRGALVGKSTAIMTKAAEAGSTLTAEEKTEFDQTKAEISAIDQHIDRLKFMQGLAGASAAPVAGDTAADGSQTRAPTVEPVIKAAKTEPGVMFTRIVRTKALARLDGENPREMAKQLYGESSEIVGILTKAAVSAMSTGGASNAKPLVNEGGAFADFVEFLRPQTILGRFGTGNIPSLRRVPFRVPLIGQTSGGQGYWVGEGKAKPLTKFDFEKKLLEPCKVANIAVATMEVLRDSSPSAELILRDSLAAALRARLDTDFIAPNKAAVANVSPGSITNGAVFVASAGDDADAVRQDLKAAFGAFIAANNTPTNGVWIMPSTVALSLSLMTNPLGQKEFPGITMGGGTLEGLPVIVSEYVPTAYDHDGAGTAHVSGAIVSLVNASDIYLADDGDIAVDMSQEASLEMVDNPTGDSVTPTAVELVSMFQTNSVAFRAERTINWARRLQSAVVTIAGVNWGRPAPAGG